eukprot:UN14201
MKLPTNLYVLMTNFYWLFPELLPNEFYITGESYGGHYVPAFGHYIHEQNKNSPVYKINLAGVAIGDGWIDPIKSGKRVSFVNV